MIAGAWISADGSSLSLSLTRYSSGYLHNNTLSQQPTTTMLSNDTLVDTSFQLISGFFHVNQGVLCSKHAEQASSRGVLEGGRGATGLLNKGGGSSRLLTKGISTGTD